METMEAATETNASTEDAGVQYVNCHRLSDEEKRQFWASRPNEGDVVNGKADIFASRRPSSIPVEDNKHHFCSYF
jgi:hypothetical protein